MHIMGARMWGLQDRGRGLFIVRRGDPLVQLLARVSQQLWEELVELIREAGITLFSFIIRIPFPVLCTFININVEYCTLKW